MSSLESICQRHARPYQSFKFSPVTLPQTSALNEATPRPPQTQAAVQSQAPASPEPGEPINDSSPVPASEFYFFGLMVSFIFTVLMVNPRQMSAWLVEPFGFVGDLLWDMPIPLFLAFFLSAFWGFYCLVSLVALLFKPQKAGQKFDK